MARRARRNCACPVGLVSRSDTVRVRRRVACRDGPLRSTPLAQTFKERAQLELDKHLALQLPNSDQEAFRLLVGGKVQGALLPRPFGFWAEERGFERITDWPDVVDDPLPITIETTEKLLREREKDLTTFLNAHREGIRYFKANRAEAIRVLQQQFGHSPSLAAKTFSDYVVCMEERLTVDYPQLKKLVAQVAPDVPGGARQVAAEWIAPGALKA